MVNLLIVEDEERLSDIIVEFLAGKGYKVDTASTLSEGLERAESKYDIVLLDISLGGGETGFPVLEKVKKKDPDTQVLMFSAYDSDDNIKTAKKLGADGFIPKPFRIEFLQDFLIPKIEHIKNKKVKKDKD